MIISIIAAMSERGVIGYRGTIPWDIPSDRRRFRELTMGHTLIMGRKTFESIGRPLPGRRNIVLSRKPDYKAEGCLISGSLEQALLTCSDSEEVFICGGEELYRKALPLAENIFLTIVHADTEGDAFFPPIPDVFIVTERCDVMDNVSCTFIVCRRRIG